MPRPPFEISWTAPEFEYREKAVSWYWMTIIAAVILLAIAIFERNILFGFFIVVAELLILFWGAEQPKALRFVLNQEGLEIVERAMYPYEEMASWSERELEGDPHVILTFRLKKRLRAGMVILLPKEHLPEIERRLLPILPKEEAEQTLADSLERFIRF